MERLGFEKAKIGHGGQGLSFKNPCPPERYVSGEARYWIGKIRLEKLQAAAWLHDAGVNVIEIKN
ncbi:MAG: hypothetical protein ACKVUS_08955 [Saprospiraceae bacterium]